MALFESRIPMLGLTVEAFHRFSLVIDISNLRPLVLAFDVS